MNDPGRPPPAPSPDPERGTIDSFRRDAELVPAGCPQARRASSRRLAITRELAHPSTVIGVSKVRRWVLGRPSRCSRQRPSPMFVRQEWRALMAAGEMCVAVAAIGSSRGISAQMIRFPRRAWLVGLGIATGLALAAGGSARADDRLSNPNFAATAGFKICENQTYALCAIAGCFVFNEVSYCRCDVKMGKSISLPFQFDGARMSAPSMPRAPPTVTW
jgi:hypothetical protein